MGRESKDASAPTRPILTDIVVKAHECACELALVFHDDPDGRADTPVDELKGEDRRRHCSCKGWLGEFVVDAGECSMFERDGSAVDNVVT